MKSSCAFKHNRNNWHGYRSDSLRRRLWHGDEYAGSSLVGAVRINACERRKRSRTGQRKSSLWGKSWDKAPSQLCTKEGWRSSVGSTSEREPVANWLKSSQKFWEQHLQNSGGLLYLKETYKGKASGQLYSPAVVLRITNETPHFLPPISILDSPCHQ